MAANDDKNPRTAVTLPPKSRKRQQHHLTNITYDAEGYIRHTQMETKTDENDNGAESEQIRKA